MLYQRLRLLRSHWEGFSTWTLTFGSAGGGIATMATAAWWAASSWRASASYCCYRTSAFPYFEDLERYWPVILIVVGVAQAARSMGMGGRVWGGAVFVVGVIFLLNNFGVIHGNVWRFLWPGILIMVGLGMLARAIDRQAYGGIDGATAARRQEVRARTSGTGLFRIFTQGYLEAR